MSTQPLLNTAVRAARRAGQIITSNLHRLDRINVETKGRNDFVSEVDRRAEDTIIDVIRSAYPDHGFIAEESGHQEGKTIEWIIDPLDGTTNFLHGYPHFAVSIAGRLSGKLEVAVIYDPMSNELFTATRGGGAYLNDRRIRVSPVDRLDNALIGTGFPFRALENMDAWIRVFSALAPRTSGIRRPGSAALDLASVAAGRFDGFWEMDLKIWDIAAGVLLVREAGGLVADFDGGQDYLESGNIIGANPKIFKPLLDIVRTRSAGKSP